MRVLRIEREKYLETTLLGIGAARTEGFRWNGLNTHLAYTSASRALAILEVSMHLDISEDLPTDRHIVEINLPDSIGILELGISDLPQGWNNSPPIAFTQIIGDTFVADSEFAVLKVPSAIVPQEFNYLINPNHSGFNGISIVSTTPMAFDPRLRQ